ncbi:sialate O-acetylesterase [Xanthocytophaga agilis]|uniref:Sialate O-acetylesterase n=1 Tax=Xanthocytophaga agilis TaxID=3048010 RepID=A0AAE3R862_9BACT|nr:sialate O-acetylesterase [Xanthocytophaga agilis]MDJ1503352.1 sialate O-acetylesterase [Xanthocytophaga agilis]
MKKLYILLFLIIIAVAFFGGMITQKHYGLGNLLKKANPTYIPQEKREAIAPEHRGKLSIFILAGQSNMEGDGNVEDYTPVNTDGRVYMFNENYLWLPGKEPVRNRIGPSIAFAKQIIDYDKNSYVGIINVARGGTNIGQWQKSYDEQSLYQIMLKRALASSSQGEIKGLLFFQGENDAEGDSTDHYNDWDVYFEKFVKDIRHDLHNEDLPVIFAQIGKGEDKLWKKVKNRQDSVNIKNVAMIKTDDLDFIENNVHFTTKGYVEIGKRFGDKFIEEVMSPSKNIKSIEQK